MSTTLTLVAHDALAQLDAAGIRYEVVQASSGATTLRFDVDSLDRLGVLVEEADPEFDIDDGCPSCSYFGDALALTELALAAAEKRIADLEPRAT